MLKLGYNHSVSTLYTQRLSEERPLLLTVQEFSFVKFVFENSVPPRHVTLATPGIAWIQDEMYYNEIIVQL